MKKKVLLLLSLFMVACDGGLSSSDFSVSNTSLSSEVSSSAVSVNSSIDSLVSTSNQSSSSNSNISTSLVSSSSSLVSENINDKIPQNKSNKIVLGNNNESMTSFSFKNSLPSHFRAIYGYNYLDKGDYYSNDGSLQISSDYNDKAKQGFQTGMFISNLKLEIRLQIGEMHAKQKSNYKKNEPILYVYGFDESGNLLQTLSVDEFTKQKENSYIRLYMKNALNVAYLEVIANQLPYSNGQSYNFGFKGIDLIAWPYA